MLLIIATLSLFSTVSFSQNLWLSADTLFIIKPDSFTTSGGFDLSNGIISDNNDVLCAFVFDQAFAASKVWKVSATSPYIIFKSGTDVGGDVSTLRDSVVTNIGNITTNTNNITTNTNNVSSLAGVTYITQTNHAVVTNEQALDLLANGLMKNNAGVVQIAVAGTDYVVSVSTLRDSVIANISSINDLEGITYITQTNHAAISNEQALDLLSTGILKQNSGTISIAVAGTDYLTTIAMSAVTGKAKPFDAIAFFSPTTNGADLDTLWTRDEFYAFDSATAESLFVNWRVPDGATQIDSVKLIVSASSAAGDSVAFALAGASIGTGDPLVTATSSPVADTLDLGGTANLQRELLLVGTFVAVTAGDLVRWQLYRDVSISNDEAGDVRFHHALFYYQ
jgi:hypothetical protein